jgi:hypothetical protein
MSQGDVVGAVDSIDLLTQRGPGVVVLIMTQVAEWDDSDEQLSSIQSKLNHYLSYVLDGGLAAQYPQVASSRWIIRLDCHEELPGRIDQFIRVAQSKVRNHGGDLEIGRLWE